MINLENYQNKDQLNLISADDKSRKLPKQRPILA